MLQSIKATEKTKPSQKLFLLHPDRRTKSVHWRGHAAHSLIKKCGYIEITKEEYEREDV